MSKIDLIDNGWVDLVFEGRNKEYGAYKLRKNTGKRNVWSIFIMLAIAALLAAILGVNAIIEANRTEEISAEVELSQIAKKEVKVEQEVKPKVEELKPVEKVASSVKFVPPVIKKDSEVKPEDEMKTQDDMNDDKRKIGAVTVEGNDDKGGEVLKLDEKVEEKAAPKEDNTIFTSVEQKPEFPGGEGALMAYLSQNIRYPAVAQENGIKGNVVVQFVVEKDGSITDVQVVRSPDKSLSDEAVRVVKTLPRFKPGRQNGQNVRVKYTLPVRFQLQN